MDPFEAFNRLKPCRYGPMLYNFRDQYVGRSLDLYGEFSEGEVSLFRELIRPGDVVIDAGANIGALTVPLAQIVGPEGRVIAFEPQRILFQTLCANLALNNIPNAYGVECVLGAEPGTVVIPPINYCKENNFGGLELGSYEVGEPVEVVTLDSFELDSCDFIKIDVQGMEEQVLRGAADLIARSRPLLYVEDDSLLEASPLMQYIYSLNYRMYRHTPLLFNPSNFLGNSDNVFADMASMNLVCVPHESAREPKNLG